MLKLLFIFIITPPFPARQLFFFFPTTWCPLWAWLNFGLNCPLLRFWYANKLI